MNLSFTQSIAYAAQHKRELIQLAEKQQATIILFPSFPALEPIATLFSGTSIAVGAQDCSAHESGAYTGQVDAQTIAQTGARFCLIGHSEQRAEYQLSNQTIAQKAKHAINNGLTPLLCVGETEQERNAGKTKEILAAQIEPVVAEIKNISATPHVLIIAYEPRWAIGTGHTPSAATLNEIFSWLNSSYNGGKTGSFIRFLYGGSVVESSHDLYVSTPHLSGFLIGGASLDFQKFQSIVSWNN